MRESKAFVFPLLLLSCAAYGGIAFCARENRPSVVAVLLLLGFAWICFALLCRLPPPPVALCFAGAVLLRLFGVFSPTIWENDYFRYLWDGRELILTGDPYQRAPADAFFDPEVPERFHAVLDGINHPEIPTIYGPVAQVAFALAYILKPGDLLGWKLLLWMAELCTLGILARRFSSRALLLYGWCPLVIFEIAFNAHLEAIGILFLVLAWALLNRPSWAGCALALTLGTKMLALPLAGLLLLRNRLRGLAIFVTILGLLYLPFLLRGSLAEWPALVTMGKTWEFNSLLFGAVQYYSNRAVANFVAAMLSFLLLSFAGWRVWKFPNDLAKAGVVVIAGFLAVGPVLNPWYLLWLFPCLLEVRWSWPYWMMAASMLSYITGSTLGEPTLARFENPMWVRPVEAAVIVFAVLMELICCYSGLKRMSLKIPSINR